MSYLQNQKMFPVDSFFVAPIHDLGKRGDRDPSFFNPLLYFPKIEANRASHLKMRNFFLMGPGVEGGDGGSHVFRELLDFKEASFHVSLWFLFDYGKATRGGGCLVL